MFAIPLGKRIYDESGNGEYDIDAITAGDISISPLTLERTDLEVYRKIRESAR